MSRWVPWIKPSRLPIHTGNVQPIGEHSLRGESTGKEDNAKKRRDSRTLMPKPIRRELCTICGKVRQKLALSTQAGIVGKPDPRDPLLWMNEPVIPGREASLKNRPRS